jgi:hypothetical protein
MGTLLTTWEAKERAGLLALEPEEWREKRLVAENRDTAPNVLAEFGNSVLMLGARTENTIPFAGLLAEAIAAHPNTPLAVFDYLLDCFELPLTFPAFCRNPIMPLLSLEQPDFWQRMYSAYERCQMLLREENLPLAAVYAFTAHPEEKMVREALLHISIAGEVQTEAEAIEGIRFSDYAQYTEDYQLHLYTCYERNMESLRAEGYAHLLRSRGTSAQWMNRLFVAFQLPLSNEPLFEGEQGAADWNRSPLDLLHHLSHDGNRLVRWAARTRLADPDFVFTWHDEEKGKG